MAKDGLRFLNLDPSSPVNCTCDILDKDTSTFNYIQYMFDRTNSMFRYTNLPDTIPEPILEYMLQIYGSVAIIEDNGDIYAMRANFGGPPDPYYRPTQAVIANPALNLSYTYRIVNHLPPFDKTTWENYKPCVRFLNDSQIQGLLPMFVRYATQMTENDISIRCAQINLRQQTVIVADSGVEMESANAYIKNLEAGKLAAIGKRPFLEGVTVAEGSKGQSNTVMQLIELQQYLKASWYNDIGLNSNFNMKSQYISSEEINSSADIMLPLIDNMFASRQMAVEAINKQFGTNISVEKDSAWEKKQLQADLGVSIDPVSGDIVPDSLVNYTADTGTGDGPDQNPIPTQQSEDSQETTDNFDHSTAEDTDDSVADEDTVDDDSGEEVDSESSEDESEEDESDEDESDDEEDDKK